MKSNLCSFPSGSMTLMKHVNVGVLPIGTDFLRIDCAYRKTGDEYAVDMDGTRWVMEPHYGCVITQTQFDRFGLSESDIRMD